MYISALTVGSGKGRYMRDLEPYVDHRFLRGLNVSFWLSGLGKQNQFVVRRPCIASAWNSASAEIVVATLLSVFLGRWRHTPFGSGTEDRSYIFFVLFFVQQNFSSERNRPLQWASSLGGINRANCSLRITCINQLSVEPLETIEHDMIHTIQRAASKKQAVKLSSFLLRECSSKVPIVSHIRQVTLGRVRA